MPAQKKPSLETISEGWQEVAPSSSSAMTPVSDQDASSCSSESESECPSTQHIEDVAAHADSPSVDSVDSNASQSEIGSSSSPTSVSGTASTRARVDSPSEASTLGDENISASVPTPTTSVRILRVSTAQLNSPISDARAESSSSAAAAAAEAGSISSPISDSSSSSDDSFISSSEEISIPGVHVFPVLPTAGTAGRPSSPVSGVRANSGSSAAATGLAPTNAGISRSGAPSSGGIDSRVLPHRSSFPTQSGASRSRAISQNPAIHQSLIERRDYFRSRATATSFAGINGGSFAQRRAEEARLAAQGYSPRDIHPHPLRSYPVDPPCTRCRGLPSNRPLHLCFDCRVLLAEQIKYDDFLPPYDNPVTRGPSPGFVPTPLVRERNVVCRVIDHTASAGDATMANGGMRTESHMSNNFNNHVTGNNGNGRVTVDTAEGAYQAQDVRTGIRSGNDTSGNLGSNYEYDEPTRSLLQSGIPIAAMLAFSDSAVGGGFDGDGDSNDYES